MIRFVICDTATGTILRSGFCSPAMFNLQALGPNEAAIEIAAEQWPVNDTTHFIDLSGPEPVLALKEQ